MFAFSKVAWWLITPATQLLILTLLAWLLFRRRPRLSHALLALAVAWQCAIYFLPVTNWVLRPLENRFPPPPADLTVDGIIVLGGALDLPVSEERRHAELASSGDRLTALVALARRYPQAKLVFTDGSAKPFGTGAAETDFVPAFVQSLGLDPKRLILENRSRNTWENAVFSKALVHPQAGEHWLLVTSAWHMPRAIGCFRAAGWPVIAYPVDYMSTRGAGDEDFDPEWRLRKLRFGLKEWVGLIAYHLMGRTDRWLPAP